MKSNRNRILIVSLMLMLLAILPVFSAFAETTTTAPAADTEAVAEAVESESEYEIDFVDAIKGIAMSTAFAQGEWRQYAMIAVACVLLYLAIVKGFEPLLLLPSAFGMLLANLPAAGLMNGETYKFFSSLPEAVDYATKMGKDLDSIVYAYSTELGEMAYRVPYQNGGLLFYLYKGV